MKRALLGSAAALFFAAEAGPALAQIDEIVVTARKREESLQDVPVSVQAIGAAQIENYQAETLRDIENLVPNLRIQQGGSGGGGTIRLRGIGSSAISAAFDTAVAFNIDGITANSPKFLQNNILDVQQIEVLKGPQSLYFGKNASAGVISLTSNNPTEEWEASFGASYEFEEDGKAVQGYVSGPITDDLGVRVAFRAQGINEVMENTAAGPNVGGPGGGGFFGPSVNNTGPQNRHRGESSQDFRVTFDYRPFDTVRTNFKIFRSNWEHDGQIYSTDIQCRVPGQPQNTTPFPLNPAIVVGSGYDCNDDDRVVQFGDQNDIGGLNVPGNRGGVPFYDQTVTTATLRTDWDLTEALTLTNVSGWFNLKDDSNDCYGYDINGIGCNIARNARDNLSTEFRLASDWGGMFDFLAGTYYQHRRIHFNSWQYAVNASLAAGPDVNTGGTADWLKKHQTDTDAFNVFGNLFFRPIESVEIVAGARYSKERHFNTIQFPFIHGATVVAAFDDGAVVPGIEFQDDNISPEVSVSWDATDQVNFYAAWKTGFKSGGIDNSALPSASLAAAAAANNFDPLVFNSEKAKGFEAGIKTDFALGNSDFRVNVTGFRYVFEDLQVQLFDGPNLTFITTNADEVTQTGAEFEGIWQTPLEGLTFNTTVAYTDAEYTESFLVDAEGLSNGNSLVLCDQGFPLFTNGTNPELCQAGSAATVDEDLKGRQIVGNSKWSGTAGFDFSTPFADFLQFNLGGVASYQSDYFTEDASTGLTQDAHVKFNSYVALADPDGRWSIGVIGQNLTDKVTIITSGGRPFTVEDTDPVNNPLQLEDQVVNVSRGRQVTVEGKINF